MFLKLELKVYFSGESQCSENELTYKSIIKNRNSEVN